MESIVRNASDIDSADRGALEHVLGYALRADQQLVIRVITPAAASQDTAKSSPAAPPQTPKLPDWCHVYVGLSDQEIADVEEIALDRSNFGRP